MSDRLAIAETLLNRGYGPPEELNEILVMAILGTGQQLRRIADHLDGVDCSLPHRVQVQDDPDW